MFRKIAFALALIAGLAGNANAFNYFPAAADNYNWTVYRSDGSYSGIDTANGWVPQWNTWYLRYFTPAVATNLAGALQSKVYPCTTVDRFWWPEMAAFMLRCYVPGGGWSVAQKAGTYFYWAGTRPSGDVVLLFSEVDSAYMVALFNLP